MADIIMEVKRDSLPLFEEETAVLKEAARLLMREQLISEEERLRFLTLLWEEE